MKQDLDGPEAGTSWSKEKAVIQPVAGSETTTKVIEGEVFD